jgi:iron complex transport system substrate-binding protein
MNTPLRLVSLLPSATEMACALGLADELVGITHCCDYPSEIRGKPRVVHANIPVAELTLRQIDVAVSECLHAGRSLYQVDEALLRSLAPTHVLTQDLCEVCAPAGDEVARALQCLSVRPKVLSMSPHSIADIYRDIRDLGSAVRKIDRAEALIASAEKRLEAVTSRVAKARHRPRVFCAEWLDPLYCCGHWVPEQVEIAGGFDPLGRKWADSVRVSWEAVRHAAPEVLIMMPCGYDSKGAAEHAHWLTEQPGWADLPAVRDHRIFAADGGYFNRPGPRVIDGVELLASLLHPDLCGWTGAAGAFTRVEV